MKTIYYFITALLFTANLTAQAVSEESQILDNDSLPVIGVRYYYYPNLDAYFDSQQNVYVFEQNGQFIRAKEIPSGYRGYSIFNTIRVAITDYAGERPDSKLAEHRKQFPKKYSAKRLPPKVNGQEKSDGEGKLALK